MSASRPPATLTTSCPHGTVPHPVPVPQDLGLFGAWVRYQVVQAHHGVTGCTCPRAQLVITTGATGVPQ